MNILPKLLLALPASALLLPLATQANDAHHPQAVAAAAPAADMTDAEVRKIDIDTAKITLKHGEIKNLDMPAMTMVFVVKDKGLLGTLKAGDKVKFKAVNEGGKFTVTEIMAAP